MNLIAYNSLLLETINLCNIYNHSKLYSIDTLLDYILDNEIDKRLLAGYIINLSNVLNELVEMDYDLQQSEPITDGGLIIPPPKLDTVITFDYLHDLEGDYDFRGNDSIIKHSLQQAVTVSLKYQVKYILATLYALYDDKVIWDTILQ